MHAGTIVWNGLDLSGLGKPKLGISRQADPPAPAFATRQLTTLKVSVDLEAADPGTIQARVRHLQKAMQVAEGILRSATGSGHALEWLATPGGDNLAAVLSGQTNTLELNFSAVENHAEAAVGGITHASFTPAGSASPITLHAVRDLKEEIAPERHAARASARKITTTTITFTARVAQATAADPMAVRLAYLQARAAEVKALDCRQGTLLLGSTHKIVRVTQLTPLIDEGRNALDLQVQCFYSVLPDDAVAEADYDIKSRLDAGSGEEVLSFSGSIEAETRGIALARLEAIRLAESTAGRRTVSFETSDKVISGADTAGVAGADWTGGLTFSLEMRAARAGGHYNLKIASARDIRSGMRWNYSGSITAASPGAALALARSLVAATGHPVQTKSDETLEHVSEIFPPESGPAGRDFVKLDFSYEFEGPSDGFIGGEIGTDRNLPLFGEWRRMVSGFLVATTRAVAEARLTALLAGEGAAIEKTLKWSEIYLDESGSDATPRRVFQKLDFTAGARELRSQAAVKYSDSTSSDLASMTQQRDVSGSIWTDTESNAETVLGELIVALFGSAAAGQPPKVTRTQSKERWGNPGQTASAGSHTTWFQLDFQMSKTSKLTGVVGYDIIEASFTLERVGSLNQTVITPIPFDRPVVQTGTGWLPGTVSLNASCKAVVAASARTWVQGKMALVAAIGSAGVTRHVTAQPRESCTPEHTPFSGSEMTLFVFTGNYQWTFTGTVLDDLWPSGFGGLG